MPGGTSLFLGLDLRAYSAGAERLIVSGSPYHSDLSIGPIANRLENVEIAYVYTPALAQLFTLILAVPEDLFALAWTFMRARIAGSPASVTFAKAGWTELRRLHT